MSSLLCLLARTAGRGAGRPSHAAAAVAATGPPRRALGGLAAAAGGGIPPPPTGAAAAAAAVRCAPGGGGGGGTAGRGVPPAAPPSRRHARGAKPGKTHHAASRRFAVDAATGQILRRKQGMSHKRYVKSAARRRGLAALTVIHAADRRRVGVLLATARSFRF